MNLRVFTHVASIYANLWKQERFYVRKEFNPSDCLGTPTWPPFHCFGIPTWPPWRYVKTLFWAFPLTWPTFMQIYLNKRKRLHKKRVQLPKDLFGGARIWPRWRHVKTLYKLKTRWTDSPTQTELKWTVCIMASNFVP